MVENSETGLLSQVAKYYSDKLAEHGQTPRGVDWNSEESQILRFRQLTKVIETPQSFSLNDLGCGYGALYDYLQKIYGVFSYSGCDVSEAMISAAQNHWSRNTGARFVVASEPPSLADYGVASGIFNVRLDRTDSEWWEYLQSTLGVLDRTSLRGFAFNCLTSHSHAEKMRDYLYYADPCRLFDLCQKRYSRNVALLHDYGLYEFTLIVRKQP